MVDEPTLPPPSRPQKAKVELRLFTDEHPSPRLAEVLREYGLGRMRKSHEVGRANQSISDEDQLEYATQVRRALLTFNISDFVQLDSEWKVLGKEPAGIIVSSEIVNFSLPCARASSPDLIAPDIQHNTLLWPL
ncbi:MAG: DUF5615 family PIN-like protein [Thermomicrobiales bacterium]